MKAALLLVFAVTGLLLLPGVGAQSVTWVETQVDAVDSSNNENTVDHVQVNNTLMVCEKFNTGLRFYKSTNLGASWAAPVTVSSSETANSMCSIDAATENHAIIVWDTPASGLNAARTSNGGTSWSAVAVDGTAGVNGGLAASVAYETPTHIIAAHQHTTASPGDQIRFCESLDRGATWACAAISDPFLCVTPGRIQVIVEATDTYVITAFCADYDTFTANANGGMSRYRSTNGGTSFTTTGVVRCQDEQAGNEVGTCQGWFEDGDFAQFGRAQYAMVTIDVNSEDAGDIEDQIRVYSAIGSGNWSKLGLAFEELRGTGIGTTSTADVVIGIAGNGAMAMVKWEYGSVEFGTRDLEYSASTNGGQVFGLAADIDIVSRGCDDAEHNRCVSAEGLSDGSFSVFIASNAGHFHYGSSVLEIPPSEPVITEPTEFSRGLVDFARAIGFQSPESLLLFALILIAIVTVTTGTSLKFMSPGRTKNLLVMGSGVLVGVFCVLLLLMDFWMFTVALVLSAFAVRGTQEARNTLREARDFARKTFQDSPPGFPPPSRTLTTGRFADEPPSRRRGETTAKESVEPSPEPTAEAPSPTQAPSGGVASAPDAPLSGPTGKPLFGFGKDEP